MLNKSFLLFLCAYIYFRSDTNRWGTFLDYVYIIVVHACVYNTMYQYAWEKCMRRSLLCWYPEYMAHFEIHKFNLINKNSLPFVSKLTTVFSFCQPFLCHWEPKADLFRLTCFLLEYINGHPSHTCRYSCLSHVSWYTNKIQHLQTKNGDERPWFSWMGGLVSVEKSLS